MELLCKFELAIFYRFSGNYKGILVRMLQEYNEKNRVLAVGDGYNDINMLASANIGIAIKEKENDQSSKFADYSVGDFSQVINLIFVFGRECYRKNSQVVIYNFSKNFLITFP